MNKKRSYVCGTSDRPLIYQTIGEAFDRAVEKWPDQEALVACHQGIRWTYTQLRQAVDRFAAGLVTLGLAPGDRIGIWSPNNAEWVVAQLATAKAGLILVNINPAYRLAELEYALTKSGCTALILADKFKSSDYTAMICKLAPEIARSAAGELSAAALPELRRVIRIADDAKPGFLSFSDVGKLANAASIERLRAVAMNLQPEDAINIQFTSGTTGFPKGATLSHFNILNNAFFSAERMNFTAADRLCIPLPLYHCFGMVLGVLVCITHGAAMVLPGEAFEPGAVLGAVQAEGCTALHGVPTMFIALLEHPDFQSFDFSSLRTGIMAGAPCPIEVMKRVVDEMHMRQVTIAYGMTETSPVSFQGETDDPLEKRVTTVGRIHPFVEVKIVDEQGRLVARGQTGELLTRGYSVMSGYWNDQQKTSETIDKAGWIHTGDLATIDDDGYCNIVGRLKEMVIRGGENVYPREIEEFLFRHPKIQEAQVFGVPDDKYGEEICAWIRLHEGKSATAEEIREFCKGQIAHFKIPRYIRLVDEFPMTVTGKAQKFRMRDAMIQELGLARQRTA